MCVGSVPSNIGSAPLVTTEVLGFFDFVEKNMAADRKFVVIEYGIDLKRKNAMGETLLHQALKCERVRAALWLMQNGADMTACSGEIPQGQLDASIQSYGAAYCPIDEDPKVQLKSLPVTPIRMDALNQDPEKEFFKDLENFWYAFTQGQITDEEKNWILDVSDKRFLVDESRKGSMSLPTSDEEEGAVVQYAYAGKLYAAWHLFMLKVQAFDETDSSLVKLYEVLLKVILKERTKDKQKLPLVHLLLANLDFIGLDILKDLAPQALHTKNASGQTAMVYCRALSLMQMTGQGSSLNSTPRTPRTPKAAASIASPGRAAVPLGASPLREVLSKSGKRRLSGSGKR